MLAFVLQERLPGYPHCRRGFWLPVGKPLAAKLLRRILLQALALEYLLSGACSRFAFIVFHCVLVCLSADGREHVSTCTWDQGLQIFWSYEETKWVLGTKCGSSGRETSPPSDRASLQCLWYVFMFSPCLVLKSWCSLGSHHFSSPPSAIHVASVHSHSCADFQVGTARASLPLHHSLEASHSCLILILPSVFTPGLSSTTLNWEGGREITWKHISYSTSLKS